jgi:hypothetical protein
MGHRKILKEFSLLDQQDSTINQISKATDISGLDNVTYRIKIDSTVDAYLEVQFCNDEVIRDDSEFYPLDFGQVTPLDGSIDENYMVKMLNHGFKWARLVTENNGGIGNISAWITGNSVGA